MLRSLTGSRRKFSFDLALHRSREKKQASKRDAFQQHVATAEDTNRVISSGAEVGAVEPGRPSLQQLGNARSFLGPKPEDKGDETRQSWRDMQLARERATRHGEVEPSFRPKPESAHRGRRSARGDDAPRIRELSRDASRERRAPVPAKHDKSQPQHQQRDAWAAPSTHEHRRPASRRVAQPPEPALVIQAPELAAQAPAPAPVQSKDSDVSDFARSLFGSSSRPSRHSEQSWYSAVLGGSSSRSSSEPPRSQPARKPTPTVVQEPPSWQELKAKALEADYASMVNFFEAHDPGRVWTSSDLRGRRPLKSQTPTAGSMRASSASRATVESGNKAQNDDASFERWFVSRFPENNVSSAPASHKALWFEYERQRRTRRRAPLRVQQAGLEAGYLNRLRSRATPGLPSSTPPELGFKSGCISKTGRVLRDGGSTTVFTLTWRVERWSVLPAGFRQGARYRPPGGAPWSLDLYKGGIKREKPGMIALYVHYDAPDNSSFATVTSLELSLMNQATGCHLARKHEGTRIFGPKADQRRRISTSAGTASLAHVVLTQVQPLGFCIEDVVVLRAEIEVAPPLPQHKRKPSPAPVA